MDVQLRIRIEYKMPIVSKRQSFFSKKKLQIENSGFVKTCDENVLGLASTS